MSYSIIRVVKVKSKQIQEVFKEKIKNYENIDIDLSKSYLNYDLVNDTKFDFNKKKLMRKSKKIIKGNAKLEQMPLNILMD